MCVGWKCVYIDLEEVTTEEGFLHMVVAAFAKSGVWKQITTGISKGLTVLFEGVEKMSIGPVDIKIQSKRGTGGTLQEFEGVDRSRARHLYRD